MNWSDTETEFDGTTLTECNSVVNVPPLQLK